MSIKTIVNLVGISKLFFVPAVAAIGLYFFITTHDAWFYTAGGALAALTIGLLLVRLFLAPIALSRSSEPGLLYALLKKLDSGALTFARNYRLDESSLLSDSFLSEYGLVTNIGYGRAKEARGFAIIVFGFCAYAVYMLLKKTWLALAPLGFVAVSYLIFLMVRKKSSDPAVLISFSDQGLLLYGESIEWKNVRDWEYEYGGENQGPYVIIYHGAPDEEARKAIVRYPGLDTSLVDLAMLLLYFKTKYGQQ